MIRQCLKHLSQCFQPPKKQTSPPEVTTRKANEYEYNFFEKVLERKLQELAKKK